MDIKHLIECDNYIIICDTSVYLNIYRYSPEFSEFALQCMTTIKPFIILPATVHLEYNTHRKKEFSSMKKKVESAWEDTNKRIKESKAKGLSICDTLKALHYPDISVLKGNLEDKFNELDALLNDFFENKNILEFISNTWGDDDLVHELIKQFAISNQIMPPITQEDLYHFCDEGKNRYKNTIPPGFKDAKDKDGVRKYSDLIIWKEIIRYAKDNKKNVIFVTNDVKKDWWIEEDDNKQFHPNLIEEFERKTSQIIIAYTPSDFFKDLSDSFNLRQTDSIEIALRITDDDYFERINEKVFDAIVDKLSISGDDYIDTFSSHIGTEGIDELEIVEHEFLSAEQVDRDSDNITYVFKYEVNAEATSYDYWATDDDTKDVVLSPGSYHKFKGTILVEVVREADIFIDFESDDDFKTAEIVEGDLVEIEFIPYYEEDDDYLEGAYTTCPHCDRPINHDNDGGNGFCIICAPEH